MGATGIISIAIIVLNVIVSYKGFKNHSFFDAYAFDVDKILINKQYYRLVTSGFLHVNWMHLIFNMFSLFFFSFALESYLGSFAFIIVYFSSLIGGDLFALFMHRNHGDYTAVGASGAVCGVIFAAIALFPGMWVPLIFIPVPGWLFGLVFVVGSVYGIRSGWQNIGHDAHLGGALAGMFVAIAMHPGALLENWLPIVAVTVPSAIFIYIIISRPHLLFVNNLFFKNNNYNYTVDHRYNLEKVDKQKEVDRILDKINRHGIKSLSPKERHALKEYSKVIQ